MAGLTRRVRMAVMRSVLLLLGLATLLALSTCAAGDDPAAGEQDPDTPPVEVEDPPTARLPMVQSLRADLEAERHPSDGGGRAWIETEDGAPPVARVGTPGTWTIIFETGEHGVAEGGYVFLQVSSFWGWDPPQSVDARFRGFTEITTDAEGVTLTPIDQGNERLPVRVGGRSLLEGERVKFVYGAGDRGALPDRYRDRGERIWVAVDGDGDGVFGMIEDSPRLDVLPGPPARLAVHLPSVVGSGEEARLTVAVLDHSGSTGVEWEGAVELEAVPAEFGAPEAVELTAADAATKTVVFTPSDGGPYSLLARFDPDGEGPAPTIEVESNPMLVSDLFRPVFWGDLHGHSNLTDGTGAVADYFAYARDVAALDVVALTDHDHWGVLPVDSHPDMWAEIQSNVKAFHADGRFVTLLGYEWTSWIHGHRHVMYFADEGELYSTLDPRYETPSQLWDALRGQPAMTFAHHSAGGPIATNWSYRPDPELEPVTEITSVHGVSEAIDSPARIYSPLQGNFVRDVLDRGYVLGFLGSGDGHDGHPGLTHLADGARKGGLAGILAEEATRESVREALQARRVYATNGQRIFLATRLAGAFMGASVPASELDAEEELVVLCAGTGPIERVELIRSGAVALAIDVGGQRWVQIPIPVDGLVAGEYVYVRVVQRDGGLAWSSPFFIGE